VLAEYETAHCFAHHRRGAIPRGRHPPKRMNPNTCTICETMFERVMKARQVEIDATILFADLRGYTSLSQPNRAARSPNF
jgi:class 3 adenylate cyclase